MTQKKNGIIITVVIAVVIIGLAAMMSRPVSTTPGERIGNAVDEISEGRIGEAAEELDPNRTVGEKIGDKIGDAGEKIEDANER